MAGGTSLQGRRSWDAEPADMQNSSIWIPPDTAAAAKHARAYRFVALAQRFSQPKHAKYGSKRDAVRIETEALQKKRLATNASMQQQLTSSRFWRILQPYRYQDQVRQQAGSAADWTALRQKAAEESG